MSEIPAKTIITKQKHPEYWFGNDFNMNLYKGCLHGCIYCDSRSLCYQIENFDQVRIKKDAISIIESQLKTIRQKGVVGTGSMSDPYNPFEKNLGLTRQALVLLHKYGFGTGIATKSHLVTRDIDILSDIQEKSPVIVCVTVTSSDNQISKLIEPNVSLSSERLDAIRQLSEKGVFCGLLMMPLLPMITGSMENVIKIVDMAKKSGADFIYPSFGFTMREGNREYLYAMLDRHFPGYKEKYIELYGNNYQCKIPDHHKIRLKFEELCRNNGILYQMHDIISRSKERVKQKQLSFFQVD
ncbi:MAG: radical SAM protein [Clostridia bacterium]|nr:radical SAM protein [Clostridia bacterium]